jgi:hypothetical protein
MRMGLIFAQYSKMACLGLPNFVCERVYILGSPPTNQQTNKPPQLQQELKVSAIREQKLNSI